MLKNTLIIALIILALYLYYQNRKLAHLPASSPDNSTRTIYEVGEDHEDLIADKDAALRSKNEAEQEVSSLTNRLKNKQSEVSRKEQEIERLKSEKSQSEIALNKKLTERKKELEELQKKYSKQGQLLDEEQLENNQLTEKIEKLESQITELQRAKSPMPGEFPPEDELIQTHQEQLRKINTLFDENAKDYAEIDFNGLYALLETIAEAQKKKKNRRANLQPTEKKEINLTEFRS
jgi:chromosome segregation ATPase